MEKKLLMFGVFLFGIQICQTNYISDPISADSKCSHGGLSNIIQLGPKKQSSVILKATTSKSYHPFGNCTFTIVPSPGYGVIAYIRKMDLRRNIFKCTDYVTLTHASYPYVTSPICSIGGIEYTTGTYSESKNMNISFYTEQSKSSVSEYNFEIVLTQYENGFCNLNEYQCRNSRCIYEGLRCDGRNNCGDDSDEICTTRVGRLVGGIIGAVAIVAIAIGFALLLRRRRSRITTTTTTLGGIANPGATVYQTVVPGTYPTQQTAYPPQPSAYQMPPQYVPQSQYPAPQSQYPGPQSQYPPPQYPPPQYATGHEQNAAYPTK